MFYMYHESKALSCSADAFCSVRTKENVCLRVIFFSGQGSSLIAAVQLRRRGSFPPYPGLAPERSLLLFPDQGGSVGGVPEDRGDRHAQGAVRGRCAHPVQVEGASARQGQGPGEFQKVQCPEGRFVYINMNRDSANLCV